MHDTCTLQCATTTTVYPSFSPIPAPLPGQPTEIIVETTLEIAGVTAQNFESLKASLKKVIATVLGVLESQLSLSFASGRRFLSAGNVVVEITAADQSESAGVVSNIRSSAFTSNLNTEITQEAQTNNALAVVSVTSASAPVLVTTTTTTTQATSTTTTTGSGSSTLFACFALVISAIIL